MGARIDATDGHAPVTIHGTRLHALTYRPETPSAQVKSAVLLAGLHADGTTSVIEPAATRDHTEQALTAFGGAVTIDGMTVSVTGGQRLRGRTLSVPGDFSSAAFWLVGAAALPGSRVEIEGVGLNPTRTALLEILRRFGARVEVHVTATEAGEPRGTVIVEGDRTGALEIAPEEVPGLIDELPAIAALAAHGGEVIVRGAGELRVKESDRIAALVAGFRALGIDADERPDGFVVRGRSSGSAPPSGGTADARGDHRMAMAFAIAALAAGQPSTINGSDVVAISYPGFFETLSRLVAPSTSSGRRERGPSLDAARDDPEPVEGSNGVKADKIYLVGFMAAGKTTVARALAKRLDWQVVDVDELIEQREHQSVAEIFVKRGEAFFRAAERSVLAEQLTPRHLVVARAEARSPTHKTCSNQRRRRLVWLDVPLERLIDRVPADGRRPLAADRAGFERLYHQRRAAYEQAHVRLDAGRAGVDALVEQLIDWLEH